MAQGNLGSYKITDRILGISLNKGRIALEKIGFAIYQPTTI